MIEILSEITNYFYGKYTFIFKRNIGYGQKFYLFCDDKEDTG